MMRNTLIVLLILIFETPCLAGKCIPECETITKKIVKCKSLKDGAICFDCGGASAVNWTLNGGPVPPNMCASGGLLWATDQDTSASLNSGTYECWPNNSSESRTPIKTVKVKFIDARPYWVLDSFNLTCPTQFCAKSFTWTFARSLTGPYLERLPPYVTRNGDNIMIKNMTKAAVGFYNCSVTPEDDTLPLASRIVYIQMQQPPKVTSTRFTNCERTLCATKSSTTQSYKCNGILAVQPPLTAQLILTCPSIGRLLSTLRVGREYYASKGRLVIQYSSREDLSFTTTVSITNVNAGTNETECEVKVGRNKKEFDVRNFALCFNIERSMTALIVLIVVCIIVVIVFVILAIILVKYCRYRLWFWYRRTRHRLCGKKRTEPVAQPQVLLVYCREREDIAKETETYLLEKLRPHIGCHLVREWPDEQDCEDAIEFMVQTAHTIIVLLESASWNDEIFQRALELSFMEENQTRIYICKRDAFNISDELLNTTLVNEVMTELTPVCRSLKRFRKIPWNKMDFNKKELLLHLRIVLPINALRRKSQDYPLQEPFDAIPEEP